MESFTSPTKRLILECAYGVKGVIDTLETDTLANVREKIHEELDDDLIPSPAFGFHIDEIRISLKQEKKNRAWDVLSKNVRLQVKKPIPFFDGFNNGTTLLNQNLLQNNPESPPTKRMRTDLLAIEYNFPRAVSEDLCMKDSSGLARKNHDIPPGEQKSLTYGSNEMSYRYRASSSVASNTAEFNKGMTNQCNDWNDRNGIKDDRNYVVATQPFATKAAGEKQNDPGESLTYGSNERSSRYRAPSSVAKNTAEFNKGMINQCNNDWNGDRNSSKDESNYVLANQPFEVRAGENTPRIPLDQKCLSYRNNQMNSQYRAPSSVANNIAEFNKGMTNRCGDWNDMKAMNASQDERNYLLANQSSKVRAAVFNDGTREQKSPYYGNNDIISRYRAPSSVANNKAEFNIEMTNPRDDLNDRTAIKDERSHVLGSNQPFEYGDIASRQTPYERMNENVTTKGNYANDFNEVRVVVKSQDTFSEQKSLSYGRNQMNSRYRAPSSVVKNAADFNKGMTNARGVSNGKNASMDERNFVLDHRTLGYGDATGQVASEETNGNAIKGIDTNDINEAGSLVIKNQDCSFERKSLTYGRKEVKLRNRAISSFGNNPAEFNTEGMANPRGVSTNGRNASKNERNIVLANPPFEYREVGGQVAFEKMNEQRGTNKGNDTNNVNEVGVAIEKNQDCSGEEKSLTYGSNGMISRYGGAPSSVLNNPAAFNPEGMNNPCGVLNDRNASTNERNTVLANQPFEYGEVGGQVASEKMNKRGTERNDTNNINKVGETEESNQDCSGEEK